MRIGRISGHRLRPFRRAVRALRVGIFIVIMETDDAGRIDSRRSVQPGTACPTQADIEIWSGHVVRHSTRKPICRAPLGRM